MENRSGWYERPPMRPPLPPGWRECPEIGSISKEHHLIPMKVPLGATEKCPNMLEYTGGHWCPEEALSRAHELVTLADPAAVVGMVLDLSNSNRYYDPQEIEGRNVRYCKVPCIGRGESPEPLAVNMAVWEIRKALTWQPNMYILVHCTHGFNRSGFIIVSAAMRLLAEQGWCVERLLRRFGQQRPPGIYKNQYITDLFKRHNEHRPHMVTTPALPYWKPADDEDEDEAMPPAPQHQAPAARMCHSDKVGELVCMEEARWVLNVVYDTIAGQEALYCNRPLETYPHYYVRGKPAGQLVIGSQPVSLDRENLELLCRKRYFVTWKADGTRYLILLLKFGVYLIDRSGSVRRVHMRFPSRRPPETRKANDYPMGPPHDFTLLDGEMVVDDVDMEGKQQRRRLLIYDVMMLGGEGVMDLRFAERFHLISREVVDPRHEEQRYLQSHAVDTFRYDWGWEAFSVRRKEFWPLDKARKLFNTFIPQLCHESDGLILQPYDDPYIPRTYPHLLKWKFPHMNSVDFKLLAPVGGTPVLQLNCGTRRKFGHQEAHHMSLGECGFGAQRVEFPPDVQPSQYHGKIIECSFDMEERVWRFMRDRPDKDTANHRSVFDKVMTSITDNISEEELLQVFDDALKLPIYEEEQQWLSGTHPTQLAQQQRQKQQQPQQLPPEEQQRLAEAAGWPQEAAMAENDHYQQQGVGAGDFSTDALRHAAAAEEAAAGDGAELPDGAFSYGDGTVGDAEVDAAYIDDEQDAQTDIDKDGLQQEEEYQVTEASPL